MVLQKSLTKLALMNVIVLTLSAVNFLVSIFIKIVALFAGIFFESPLLAYASTSSSNLLHFFAVIALFAERQGIRGVLLLQERITHRWHDARYLCIPL